MANWIYEVNLKPIWTKYEDLSHEDFDNDKDIFHEMKKEMVAQIKKELRPGDLNNVSTVIKKLEKAKHLFSFNNAFNSLYDYCDYRKIWIKTSF